MIMIMIMIKLYFQPLPITAGPHTDALGCVDYVLCEGLRLPRASLSADQFHRASGI